MMKKNYLFMVAIGATMFAGCSQEEHLGISDEAKSGFTGAMEVVGSRTALGEESNEVSWVTGENADSVSIFAGNNINREYVVSSVVDNVAYFELVDYTTNGEVQTIDANYALYPYSDDNKIDATSGTITASIPAQWEYTDKASSISKALMMAKSDKDETHLNFKNIQGIVLLKLNAEIPTEWDNISAISFTSNQSLAGTASLSWSDTDNVPSVEEIATEGASQTLTVNFTESQALKSSLNDEYLEIYIPVIPATFEQNEVTITITWENGGESYEQEVSSAFEVKRSEIVTLKHTLGDKSGFTGGIGEDMVLMNVSTAEQLAKALAHGGDITLESNIELTESVEIPEGVTATLNLNKKTLSGATTKDTGALLVNNGTLTSKNGTITNTAENGGATISNNGTLTLSNGTNVVGAPISTSGDYPAYCITSSGNLTIEEGASVSADRGCLSLSGTGETVINGGTFTNNDLSEKRDGNFTSHTVLVGYNANNKLTINGGTFQHLHTKTSGGVVINNWSAVTVDITGGNFSGGNYFGKWDNLSDYGYGSTKTPFSVTGGIFTGMDDSYVANGYQAVKINDVYHILPEGTKVISDASSLSTALKEETDGATIYLTAGTYDNLSFVDPANWKAKNLTIIGTEGTIIEGVFFAGEANGWTCDIDGLTFRNITFTKDITIGSVDNKNILIEKCVFTGNARINQNTSTGEKIKGLVVKNCNFTGTGEGTTTAIMLNDVTDLTVQGCTFTNIQYNAIQGSMSGTVLIDNNTITGTGDRVFRPTTIGENTTITISKNKISNSGRVKDEKRQLICIGNDSGVPASSSIIFTGNTYDGAAWAEGITITNTSVETIICSDNTQI